LLKEHASPDVYRVLGPGIAKAVAEISTHVLNPVFALHPELEQEFESNVAKYGRTS